jgi:hypothetical protein
MGKSAEKGHPRLCQILKAFIPSTSYSAQESEPHHKHSSFQSTIQNILKRPSFKAMESKTSPHPLFCASTSSRGAALNIPTHKKIGFPLAGEGN